MPRYFFLNRSWKSFHFFLSRFYFEKKIWCCVCPFVKEYRMFLDASYVALDVLRFIYLLCCFFLLHYYYLFNFWFISICKRDRKTQQKKNEKKKKRKRRRFICSPVFCNLLRHWMVTFSIAKFYLFNEAMKRQCVYSLIPQCFFCSFNIFRFILLTMSGIRSSNKSIYFSRIFKFMFWIYFLLVLLSVGPNIFGHS